MQDYLAAAVGKIVHLSLRVCVVVRINISIFLIVPFFMTEFSYSCALDFVLN